MMKTNMTWILTLLLFCTSVSIQAQVTGTKVTAENKLEENGLYLICYVSGTKFYKFDKEEQTDGSIIFSSTILNADKTHETVSYSSLASAADNSHLVQLVKQDGNWLMLDIKEQKYIGRCRITNATTHFLLSDTPGSDFYVTFSGTGSDFDILIGGKYLRVYTDYVYSLRSSASDSSYKKVALYKISGYTVSLSETSGNTIINNLTANVSLDRTLTDNCYNTLMLPFAVANYKSVFGTGVTAYQITAANNDGIFFETVPSGTALAADTPYLLNGEFAAKPYLIPSTTLQYQADEQGIMSQTYGDLDFNGVYGNSCNLGHTESFILYNNKFYICTQVASMPIAPFRWYITKNGSNVSNTAKPLFINGINADELTTGIRTESATSPQAIYNLQGIRQTAEWPQLPKGIYIRGSQKIVKP